MNYSRITRPKKGTQTRRVIVDLSFPEGAAVNTRIDTSAYLGNDITYTLPTIADLIAKLQMEGQGAFIWKADLARAYRQLRADPVDDPLLCIQFDKKIFIDRCPPSGRLPMRIGSLPEGGQHYCVYAREQEPSLPGLSRRLRRVLLQPRSGKRCIQ